MSQLIQPTVDTLVEGAEPVVSLLAKLLEYGIGQEPELKRLHGIVTCAALVLGEPEPAPLPPSHAVALLDDALAALCGRLGADVLTKVNSAREVRGR